MSFVFGSFRNGDVVRDVFPCVCCVVVVVSVAEVFDKAAMSGR